MWIEFLPRWPSIQPIRQSCADTWGVWSTVGLIDQTTLLFIHLNEASLPWPPPGRLTEEFGCYHLWRLSLHSSWSLLPSEFSADVLSLGITLFPLCSHLELICVQMGFRLMNWKNSVQEFCIRKAYLYFIGNEVVIYKWKFSKLFCWVLTGIIWSVDNLTCLQWDF